MENAAKVVLVAGATGGIGRAICTLFARNGATVVMLGRDEARLAEARKSVLEESGTETPVITVVADINNTDSVDAAVERTLVGYGAIDTLVHAAGDHPVRSIFDTTDEDWAAGLNSKLLGAVRLIRAVGRGMTERGSGSIILIGGLFRAEPAPLFPIASVLNAGIGALAKAVSKDFATKGVRINIVDPGPADTDRWRQTCEELSVVTGATAEQVDKGAVASIPMGRLAAPADIAHMTAFLASEKSAYLTGGSFIVDGGSSGGLV